MVGPRLGSLSLLEHGATRAMYSNVGPAVSCTEACPGHADIVGCSQSPRSYTLSRAITNPCYETFASVPRDLLLT